MPDYRDDDIARALGEDVDVHKPKVPEKFRVTIFSREGTKRTVSLTSAEIKKLESNGVDMGLPESYAYSQVKDKEQWDFDKREFEREKKRFGEERTLARAPRLPSLPFTSNMPVKNPINPSSTMTKAQADWLVQQALPDAVLRKYATPVNLPTDAGPSGPPAGVPPITPQTPVVISPNPVSLVPGMLEINREKAIKEASKKRRTSYDPSKEAPSREDYPDLASYREAAIKRADYLVGQENRELADRFILPALGAATLAASKAKKAK